MTVLSSLSNLKPSDLPTPPEAALQIMRACSREEVSQKEVSDLVSKDPVITVELLRIVNTPLFGMPKKVKSISRAVNLIGRRALRNMALCISVRDAIKENDIPGFAVSEFWEDSLRRAVAARVLGERFDLEGDDCFTAGLLQDFGLLVLFYLQPEAARCWSEFRELSPRDRYDKEQARLGTTHESVFDVLGQVWDLPDELLDAIKFHHGCGGLDGANYNSALCKVLCCADWMVPVYSAEDKRSAIEHCREALFDVMRLDKEQVDDCLSRVPKQIQEAAMALGLKMAQQEDFEHILRKANICLAEENISYQELTWRLESTLRERDRLAAELKRELELAREIQRSLLPGQTLGNLPITGVNEPARELSGDFYDYFCLKDGRICFNLADVSGKGVNAALLMAKTSSLFRCLGKQIPDPSRLLTQINDEIYETSTHGMYVTMVAGVFDPRDGNLTIANAGHLPVLLFSDNGKISKIGAQSPPLGILPQAEFPTLNIKLVAGSVCLYSDGVTESLSPMGEELGIEGLIKLLIEAKDQPPRQRLESIVTRLRSEASSPRDDITLLLLHSGKQSSAWMH